MERVHRDLLVLQPIASHLATFAKKDEVVGAVPGFDDVQPLVDFAAQRRLAEVTAEEDGLGRLAELGEPPVGRVLDVAASRPAGSIRAEIYGKTSAAPCAPVTSVGSRQPCLCRERRAGPPNRIFSFTITPQQSVDG